MSDGSSRRGIALPSAQRWAGTLAVASAFLGVAASGELGLPLVALFSGALVLAQFVGGRFAHKYVWAWTTLLLGLLAVFGAQAFLGATDLILAAAQFTVVLTVHRLWNRVSERDELLLLLLSLLLLCAGAALSAELLFGAAFVAYAVTGTWALALTHLRWQIEGSDSPGAATLLNDRRLVSPALLGALGGLSLLGLFGAAVVFFAFPRVTIGGLQRANHHPRAVAGLADQVDLSGHGLIGDDPTVVLRVRLAPDPGEANLTTHWRARAFEVWTGRGWRAEATPRLPASFPLPPSVRSLKQRGVAPRRSEESVASIEAVGGYSDGVILTPPGLVRSVRFEQKLSARPPAQRLLRDAAGDIFYQPIELGDLRYSVVTQQQDRSATADADRDYPPSVAIDLEVPANLNPRIRELAQRLTRGKAPAQAAAAVEFWLSHSLAYTRELPGDSADPIFDFLFVRRRGHCELFSSAMVLLLRASGIPARNVAGYYGGVRTGDGYYAVRAGDAHSWVEVYFAGAGFVPFDPTPAGDRGGVESGLVARAVLLWDSIEARWRGAVVDYDLLAQGRLLQRAAALLQEANRRLSGKGGGGARFREAWAVLAGLVLAAAAGAVLFARRSRRGPGRRTTRPLSPDQLRAQRLWRRARANLRRAGIQLSPASTALEAAGKLSGSAALNELALRCLSARWGGAALPAPEARRLLRELRRSL